MENRRTRCASVFAESFVVIVKWAVLPGDDQMKIMRAGSIGLSLILVLTNLSLPQVVRASDEPLADILYANAVAAPIGTIESSGTMLINGRAAEGSGAVWDGELLQAPAARTVSSSG